MMYKLTRFQSVVRLSDNVSFPIDPKNADYQEYLVWLALGNIPQPADKPTPEQLAREAEIIQAPLTARQYFASHPAAVAFVRLTPAEQDAQIEVMTTPQLKAVIKHLTIAVSALIKQQFLS